MVAITGQASSDKLHKEAHQVVDIVDMFAPVTKWNTRVERVEAIPEIVRKAFRVATLEKPGPTHIELPENLAASPPEGGDEIGPLQPNKAYFPEPTDEAIEHAARLIAASERPIVLAGNGVLRRNASPELRAFARGLHVPVAMTFMGKGADRRPVAPLADGGRAADARPRPGGLRPRRPGRVGRLRPGRVRAVAGGTRSGRNGSSISTPRRRRWMPPTGRRSS